MTQPVRLDRPTLRSPLAAAILEAVRAESQLGAHSLSTGGRAASFDATGRS